MIEIEKIKKIMQKKNYKIFFSVALGTGGFVWNQLLRKVGLTPKSIEIMLERLKKMHVILPTTQEEKERLKQILSYRTNAGRWALHKFKPYKVRPDILKLAEDLGISAKSELKNIHTFYNGLKNQDKQVIRQEIGRCIICGKPIYKTIYTSPVLISTYGAETINGTRMPIDSIENWGWYCSECIIKDDNLKKLRSLVIQGRLAEPKNNDS